MARSLRLACLDERYADRRVQDLSLRAVFARALRLERRFAADLRHLARAVDRLVRSHDPVTPGAPEKLRQALDAYSVGCRPYAEAVASSMVAQVAAHDDRSWRRLSKVIGEGVRETVQSAPVGELFRSRVAQTTELITSIPRDAAERVQRVARENLHTGGRTSQLVEQIFQTGGVALSKAETIARTETSRTATEFTRARAEHAGSTYYRWMTAGDEHVRLTHKKLGGTIQRWDSPPVCDPPDYRAHPGCIWNCRCWAEPIFDGDVGDPASRFRVMEV